MLEEMKRKIGDIYRPRSEVGRTIKHKIKYGLRTTPPAIRRGKNLLR